VRIRTARCKRFFSAWTMTVARLPADRAPLLPTGRPIRQYRSRSPAL